MYDNLFTQPPEPKPAKKGSFEEVWAEYKAKRDKVISKQFYNGGQIK